MADGDTVTGPTVTLDGAGNAGVAYTATSYIADNLLLVTTASGQLLVPLVSIVGNVPGVQTTGGVMSVTGAYARSQALI